MVTQNSVKTLSGRFHRAELRKEKNLGENLLEAGMFQTFGDKPEYSIVTFGYFCLISPRDISLICSVINTKCPNFTGGYFELVPGLLILLSEIERLTNLGRPQMTMDFTQLDPDNNQWPETDRIQALMCLILHGGWIAESLCEVKK